ncbi:MerR family transcriptional regulator [Streptomyces sp. AC495_CC817]|uniref:MerR family transcriptional regulator n=1 Tax=Streptomyces sp. AC495_CC817 TaxID=2823900 RepID=UPI001C26B075|nr:MerR family transcriptional regulator [Streptomyces sp. AC495_CC817]
MMRKNLPMAERDSQTPVYGIAVAAQLSGIPEASLRLFEARGLLTPARSDGGTRRYSDDDLARLQRVTDLRDEGINIAGIRRVLDLEDENAGLRAERETLDRPGSAESAASS